MVRLSLRSSASGVCSTRRANSSHYFTCFVVKVLRQWDASSTRFSRLTRYSSNLQAMQGVALARTDE